MRICVKFSREGFSKYLAHLDMQRMFVRAIKRADLPAKYSAGFNPHMNISFAYPLGVGIETRGDYLEFFTTEDIDIAAAEQALRLQMPEGFGVQAMGELDEKTGKLMALTQQAEYRLEGFCPEFAAWMQVFLQKDSYMVERERKGKVRTIDIRPMVKECVFLEDGAIRLRVDNSGSASLNPALLLKAAAKESGKDEMRARIIRMELYTVTEDGALQPITALFA